MVVFTNLKKVTSTKGLCPYAPPPSPVLSDLIIQMINYRLPTEIAVDFTSYDQWIEWTEANPHVLTPAFSKEMADIILENGFVEPLSGLRILPGSIEHTDQIREGFVVGGINSRVRAVMRLIEYHVNMESWLDLRIFAPEAVTPLALKLRSIFPRFVGSEYASDQKLREAMFPIQHEDLTRLTFPDETFDLVSTNEVLEHVPNLDLALSEIRRVLKRGCWHVGTHPFICFSPLSEKRARLTDAGIEHIKAPEYHGNPFEEGGSLVFEIPGWDILERCYKAGFSYAAMHYCISEKYGYASEDIGGIFVLCCQR